MTQCRQIDNYMVATDLEYTDWEAIRNDLRALTQSTTTKTPIHTIHDKHKEDEHTL